MFVLPEQVSIERHDHCPCLVVGVHGTQLSVDPVHFCLCLLERHTGLEPAVNEISPQLAVILRRRVPPHRNEQLGIALAAGRKKARRHDPDDSISGVVQYNVAAEDGRICVVLRPPQTVGENRYSRAIVCEITRSEMSSESCGNGKGLEESLTDKERI